MMTLSLRSSCPRALLRHSVGRTSDAHRSQRREAPRRRERAPRVSEAAGGLRDDKAEHQIWLGPRVLNRLKAMGGPGKSYSDVILRVARG
jgi:hypothetical protein